jgi:hypothetical protein
LRESSQLGLIMLAEDIYVSEVHLLQVLDEHEWMTFNTQHYGKTLYVFRLIIAIK